MWETFHVALLLYLFLHIFVLPLPATFPSTSTATFSLSSTPIPGATQNAVAMQPFRGGHILKRFDPNEPSLIDEPPEEFYTIVPPYIDRLNAHEKECERLYKDFNRRFLALNQEYQETMAANAKLFVDCLEELRVASNEKMYRLARDTRLMISGGSCRFESSRSEYIIKVIHRDVEAHLLRAAEVCSNCKHCTKKNRMGTMNEIEKKATSNPLVASEDANHQVQSSSENQPQTDGDPGPSTTKASASNPIPQDTQHNVSEQHEPDTDNDQGEPFKKPTTKGKQPAKPVPSTLKSVEASEIHGNQETQQQNVVENNRPLKRRAAVVAAAAISGNKGNITSTNANTSSTTTTSQQGHQASGQPQQAPSTAGKRKRALDDVDDQDDDDTAPDTKQVHNKRAKTAKKGATVGKKKKAKGTAAKRRISIDKEISRDSARLGFYWIFHHNHAERGEGLYTLRCPKDGCGSPVFSTHPMKRNRAVDHFQACGVDDCADEEDIVAKYARKVVAGSNGTQPTVKWATKQNERLLGANQADLRVELDVEMQ